MSKKEQEEVKIKLADVRHILEEGLLRFYYCERGIRRSLQDAYYLTLKHYFARYSINQNQFILPQKDQIPTYRQFRYVKDQIKPPSKQTIKARQ